MWKVVNRPLSLDRKVRPASVDGLNQILADTMSLRDMDKKHHWQVSGPAFYQLHLFFDKHYGEQAELVDALAERIRTLGGGAIAMAHDVYRDDACRFALPKGREDATIQLYRLIQAHEFIIDESRRAAHAAVADGDDATNDLLASDILRRNELPVWFISEQLAGVGPAWQRPRDCQFARQGSRLNNRRCLMLPLLSRA